LRVEGPKRRSEVGDRTSDGYGRGVKKVVNSSDVLCINGMDVVKLVNQLVNNSFELVRHGRGSRVEGRGREKERAAASPTETGQRLPLRPRAKGSQKDGSQKDWAGNRPSVRKAAHVGRRKSEFANSDAPKVSGSPSLSDRVCRLCHAREARVRV